MDVFRIPAERKSLKQLFRHIKHFFLAYIYVGDNRFCPLCERSSKKFLDYGVTKRTDAECVHCGALERHRLLWVFLRKKTDIFEPLNRRVLHIAPEKCLDDRLKKMYGSSYLTADIQPGLAMECMDITDIKYNDETFDVIFCSHVLEHISDDKKAINELTRVLKSGGWAIILVPIDGDYTHEDPAITDPKMREELYGQSDHVRLYGLKDYLGLLESTGLEVSVYFPQDILPPEDIIHFGIIENAGEIFLCKKPCHSK